jgi:hypothetical protein
VTLHFTDLIVVLAFVAAGCAAGYLLLLRRLKEIVAERHAPLAASELSAASTAQNRESEETQTAGGSEAIAPEIQAVIAAATVAALGQDAHVRSVKSVASPWSQQGRVLVQGSHNARAGR